VNLSSYFGGFTWDRCTTLKGENAKLNLFKYISGKFKKEVYNSVWLKMHSLFIKYKKNFIEKVNDQKVSIKLELFVGV
jgi:hypothetical protein